MSEDTAQVLGRDETYSKELTSSIDTPQVSTDLETFASTFRLSDKEGLLEGYPKDARVLMLGSGHGDLLSDIRETFPKARVMDLNPAFSDPNVVSREGRKNALAAVNPQLPFLDESFEIVIDRMASIWYSYGDSKKIVERVVEILRVTKDGGTAYIGPMIQKNRTELLTDLKKMGLYKGEIPKELPGYFVFKKDSGDIKLH